MPKLPADDRRAQRQRVGTRHFTKILRATVHIIGVRGILLFVVSSTSVENAVRTEVDQPATPALQHPREPVWKKGIDRERADDVVDLSTLLYDAKTVDDHVRSSANHDGFERVQILSI